MESATSTGFDNIAKLRSQYGCGPIEFAGTDNALYERHLVFDNIADLAATGPRERFKAFARSVPDILSQRWIKTENTYARENPKRVYYLSMEFEWAHKSILDVASSGKFSRDSTIAEYANQIWEVKPCPVP